MKDTRSIAELGLDPAEPPILAVRDLCKYFPVYQAGLWGKKHVADVKAVNHVSFDLKRNETLGLVGESGCGKSTTVRTVLRALDFTAGSAWFDPDGTGEYMDFGTADRAALFWARRRTQMIFQDPFSSLNPRMTVSRLISEPLTIHRVASGGELDDRVDAIMKKVGLKPEHKSRYPHAFSGGQRQRIGIARALIMNPAFVVADEAVSALDVSVQAQVINLLSDLKSEMGLSYIFVTHSLGVVKHICDRVAVMYAGRIVELAPTAELFESPLHPYTKLLLSSAPVVDPDLRIEAPPAGEVSDAGNLPDGCSFEPRCQRCRADCRTEAPILAQVTPTHWCACHHDSP